MEFWIIAAYCALAVAAFGYRNEGQKWEYRARRAENEIDILNRVRISQGKGERLPKSVPPPHRSIKPQKSERNEK